MQASDHRFTGRQLTLIVCAICVAVVLAPASIFAASRINTVSIADHKTPSYTATVTKSGAQVVQVAGTVRTHSTLPGKPYTVSVTNLKSGNVPKGKYFVVTGISAVGGADAGVKVLLQVDYGQAHFARIAVPLLDEGVFGSSEEFAGYVSTDLIMKPLDEIALTTAASGAGTTLRVTLTGYLV